MLRTLLVLTDWLDQAINAICGLAPPGTFFSFDFNIRSLLAVVLVSLICGAVGSMVVGNRMAFFSDALAHCAFAGVGLGLLSGLALRAAKNGQFHDWGVPLITVAFGICVGLAIAFVRERTSLASDTVIGVFFAGALGLGAVVLKELSRIGYFTTLEGLVFGDIVTVRSHDLLVLLLLGLVTAVVLGGLYNQLVFTSFNPSLARSRRIPVRLCNYLFIILLALIVNLCLKIVGALLINALLIVPAATAGNLARNMRQLFWGTTVICLFVGMGGLWLSWDVARAGSGGSIVVLSVVLFFASMVIASLRQRWEQRTRAA
jgi:zinc transport system permease protein